MNKRKLKLKAKLLSISIGFACTALACTHLLWYRSASHQLVDHCTRLNSSNISLVNMAREYFETGRIKSEILRVPHYCKDIVPASQLELISKIEKIGTRDITVIYSAITDKLVLYSEQYEKIQTDAETFDNKLVSAILILNALALVALGLFLREDLKSINE